MTQIILNNEVYLPETSRDKYRCYPATLSRQIDMISGRRVLEIRGHVQKIEYAYDYMGNALMRQVLGVLRSNASFPVTYLSDEDNELHSGVFLCESLSNPSFAFSKGGRPYWHNFSFVLREVAPHD